MFNQKFYHGTSTAVYESIKKNGFVLGEHSFHGWLGTKGIYLVCDRPLVAKKFAERTAMRDKSEPLVLEVHINLPEPNYILNLMTDDGMNLFFESYEENFRLLAKSKLGSETPKDYEDYFQSIKIKDIEIETLLKAAHSLWVKKPEEVNWDTLVVATLVIGSKICMIVAAIQEGTTFNRIFATTEPKWDKVKGYNGIRVRDHIEVCITDTNYIINEKIIPLVNTEQDQNYNRRFIVTVTNPTIPDA